MEHHSLFTQLNVLCHFQDGSVAWKETARWYFFRTYFLLISFDGELAEVAIHKPASLLSVSGFIPSPQFLLFLCQVLLLVSVHRKSNIINNDDDGDGDGDDDGDDDESASDIYETELSGLPDWASCGTP